MKYKCPLFQESRVGGRSQGALDTHQLRWGSPEMLIQQFPKKTYLLFLRLDVAGSDDVNISPVLQLFCDPVWLFPCPVLLNCRHASSHSELSQA